MSDLKRKIKNHYRVSRMYITGYESIGDSTSDMGTIKK